jgi:ADP-heptose:LPS heptosyltransferase
MKPTRVLAINFGGIGDEILFLPTLDSVRKAVPDCDLTLMVEPRSKSIQEISPLIDHVITFDIKKQPLTVADLISLLMMLRTGHYEVVVSSGSSRNVCLLLFLSGIARRIGYDSGSLARALLTKAVPLNQQQYAAMMYRDLATGLGVPAPTADGTIPKISVPVENVQGMKALLEADTTGGAEGAVDKDWRSILIHPGTSRLAIQKGVIKTWDPKNWAELIRLLLSVEDIEVLLAGGPDDEEIVREICLHVPSSPRFRNCYGSTRSLADLAALIHLSDLLVCVDSAPMHMGVGLGKPLVALFAPTDEKKLLPVHPLFLALRGSPPDANAFKRQPSATAPEQTAGRGVQLPPDTVFRSVMDQLKKRQSRGSYPESSP